MNKVLLTFFCLFSMMGLFAQDNSYKVDNATFTFRATFPCTADFQQQQTPSSMGELSLNLYLCEGGADDENLLYLINATAYPAQTVHADSTDKLDGFYKGVASGAARNVNGRLLSTKVLQVDGYEGREITISIAADEAGNEAIIRSRMVLIENVIYMIQTITKKEHDGNGAIKAFMDSFDYYGDE